MRPTCRSLHGQLNHASLTPCRPTCMVSAQHACRLLTDEKQTRRQAALCSVSHLPGAWKLTVQAPCTWSALALQ